VIGIEQFYFMTRTQQHAEFLYGLRWALVMYAIKQWRSVYDVWPTEMKKYITWRGWAKKNSIHTMIMSLYQIDVQPKFADISDALGIAYVARAMSKKV
jgi:Holliday junction resolvasome RuvABC endonuclease subunit